VMCWWRPICNGNRKSQRLLRCLAAWRRSSGCWVYTRCYMIMSALTSYPESSVRYNTMTLEFLKSNLLPQAVDLGRKAVKFNPNSVSAWALIFVNPQAPLEERIRARAEILRLDPLNTEVFKFKLE